MKNINTSYLLKVVLYFMDLLLLLFVYITIKNFNQFKKLMINLYLS